MGPDDSGRKHKWQVDPVSSSYCLYMTRRKVKVRGETKVEGFISKKSKVSRSTIENAILNSISLQATLEACLKSQGEDIKTIKQSIQQLTEASIRNDECHKQIDRKLDEYKTGIDELKTDLHKRDAELENQITVSAQKHMEYHDENESKFGVAKVISKHPWRSGGIIAGLILLVGGLDNLLLKLGSPLVAYLLKLMGL